MKKQELIETFWREIGINCPANADVPYLDWITEPAEMTESAKLVEERKIARFCAARGIVIE